MAEISLLVRALASPSPFSPSLTLSMASANERSEKENYLKKVSFMRYSARDIEGFLPLPPLDAAVIGELLPASFSHICSGIERRKEETFDIF